MYVKVCAFCFMDNHLSKIERDAALIKLKECGLSARQISRLTGIGSNAVQKTGKIY